MAMNQHERAWILAILAHHGHNEINACRIMRLMDAESDANLEARKWKSTDSSTPPSRSTSDGTTASTATPST